MNVWHEDRNNTSGYRCPLSGQERDAKIDHQNIKIQEI